MLHQPALETRPLYSLTHYPPEEVNSLSDLPVQSSPDTSQSPQLLASHRSPVFPLLSLNSTDVAPPILSPSSQVSSWPLPPATPHSCGYSCSADFSCLPHCFPSLIHPSSHGLWQYCSESSVVLWVASLLDLHS